MCLDRPGAYVHVFTRYGYCIVGLPVGGAAGGDLQQISALLQPQEPVLEHGTLAGLDQRDTSRTCAVLAVTLRDLELRPRAGPAVRQAGAPWVGPRTGWGVDRLMMRGGGRESIL